MTFLRISDLYILKLYHLLSHANISKCDQWKRFQQKPVFPFHANKIFHFLIQFISRFQGQFKGKKTR